MVSGADHGESARALAVVYNGHGGSCEVTPQGHSETDQPTDRDTGLGGVVSCRPLAPGWMESLACCLQSLEEQKCTVLELTYKDKNIVLFTYFIVKSFETPSSK